jgi:hypothetical protein
MQWFAATYEFLNRVKEVEGHWWCKHTDGMLNVSVMHTQTMHGAVEKEPCR